MSLVKENKFLPIKMHLRQDKGYNQLIPYCFKNGSNCLNADTESMTLGQYLYEGIIITEQVAEVRYSLTSKKPIVALKHKLIAK